MEELNPKFDSWAIVELFGHVQLAGKVTTQTIASQEFIRIDIPKISTSPGFTKYHLPSDIYGLTPVDEEYAIKMAERINAKPVNNYSHNEVIIEIVNERLKQIEGSGNEKLEENNQIDF